MGPAYGRDPRDARRRSRFGFLATLPRVAFRPPPLTPAPPAERLRSMASRSRHRSAVVAGLGPLAPGRRAPSCDAPHGSRLLGVGSTGAHLPGLALPWATGSSRAGKIWIPLHGFILPPAAGRRAAPKSLSPKKGRDACCVPAQTLSPLVRSGSRALCAQAPERPHRRRYPAKRKADDDTTRPVNGEPEPAAVDLPRGTERLRGVTVLEAAALGPGELDAVPLEPPLKLTHPVGAVRACARPPRLGGRPRRGCGRSPNARLAPCGPCRALPFRVVSRGRASWPCRAQAA